MSNFFIDIFRVFVFHYMIIHGFGSKLNFRPNIIIIYPDNQDLLLGSNNKTFMPILNSHIIDNGITLNNGFVSTPVCCPSRAELLTGKYFHNIGPPYPPNGTCMHISPHYAVFDNNTLFQNLHNYGYKTGAFGKIVNDMPFWCNKSRQSGESEPILNGFDRLYIPCNYLDYYGHTYLSKYDNGTYNYVLTNESYMSPSMYETSQIGNATIDWIDSLMQDKKDGKDSNNNNDNDDNEDDDNPFFILWGVHAPHHPSTPASWHSDAFNDTNKYYAPRTPNFNQHYSNRHWLVDVEPQIDEYALSFMDQLYRDRLRSMLSVDDFIFELDKILDKWNISNKTYVFYVSDNGFHIGQWSIPCNMRNIYDTDIRVPFYIRGPNIEKNTFINNMISNVDIAPTIYQITGIIDNLPQNKINDIDGKSFAKYLFNQSNSNANININSSQLQAKQDLQEEEEEESKEEWRDMLLFEYIWVGNTTFGNYNVWYPSNESFMGINKTPPKYNSKTGNIYWIDNSYQSSFRGLRIINKTMNISYAEYITGTYTQDDFDNPLWFELYNLTNDPFQMNNMYYDYNQTSQHLRDYLHNTLMQYGACKGQTCV